MKIIHEIQFNNADALRLFTSNAKARKNNLRIHYHTLIEISLILRGKGLYKTGNAVYSIQEGDIFFFRPNEAHCITDIEDSGMELLNLHIAPYYLYTNFQNALNSNYIKILAANFPLDSHKINDTLPKEQLQELKNLILAIRREFECKQSDYVTFVNNYISAILIMISRSYKSSRFSQKEKQNYQKLLSAVKYIDTHYKENITLDSLAQKVAYSRCYFSSIFKKCMGMSIWDYICIKRIEEALTLIKTTDKNILDIALDCGFNNTVNFNKIFKKYTNVSPSTFRK
ncbi:MAG: helix-turn-helix domain-containing protein [Clostridiales bacterium]|nr:helix-turn-helix domain-containing protein [Clostridiales bacterium]